MTLTLEKPQNPAGDLAAEADRSLAYWSPPATPKPRSRRLTPLEVMYAYFGSDRD